jgi:hypothetical protein
VEIIFSWFGDLEFWKPVIIDIISSLIVVTILAITG